MSTRFLTILGQGSNNAGNSIPGAKLNFFVTGTSTRADTFSDNALSIANANPVVADGNGRFGDIFLQQINYLVTYTDEDDVILDQQDPVDGTQGISGAITVDPGAPNDSLVINSSGESVGEFLVQKAGSNSISTSYKLLNVNADAGFNWQMDASNDLALFAFDSTWSSILTVDRTTGSFDFSVGGVFLGGNGAANLLDDKDQGTFTVAFTAASSGTITVNTSLDTLQFQKIGDTCKVWGTVQISSVSSPVGAVAMTGLPFTSRTNNENSDLGMFSIGFNNFSTGISGIGLVGGISPAATVVDINEQTSTGFATTTIAGEIQTGTQFRFSFTYFTT